MKLLMLIVCFAISLSAFTQQPNARAYKIDKLITEQIQKKKMDSVLQQYLNKFPDRRITSPDISSNSKQKVIGLKDGMPCIIPEKATAALIPNMWAGRIKIPFKSDKAPIPNPGLPNTDLSYQVFDALEK